MEPSPLTSIKPITPMIPFHINAKKLLEAIEKCNLGSGDISNPISANGFVLDNETDIPEFYNNEEIILTIHLNTEGDSDLGADAHIICSTIKNVTKQLTLDTFKTQELMARVFNLESDNVLPNPNVQEIALLPDGSICLAPFTKMSCKINTNDRKCSEHSNDPFCATIYVSYSIVFSFNYTGVKEPYYFIIDPLLKISSGNRQ